MARELVRAFPPPDVTVVVPTHRGADHIARCLDSLVRQSLAAERFEVVVVHNGPEDGTSDVVAGVRAAHPGTRIRSLRIDAATGAGRARNVGIAAARAPQVTFVDDDDQAGPHFLAELLAAAEPGVVPTALVADVTETSDQAPDFDNYYSHRLLRPRPESRRLDLLNAAASMNAGKLVPTRMAREIGYDESLRSGEDLVFWAEVLVRNDLEVAVVDAPGSEYRRTVRPDGVGRQGDTFDFCVDQRLACIRALTALPRTKPVHARQLGFLIQSQALWINQYLQRHPDAHPQVVQSARAQGMDRLPWRLVNRDLAHDLAITYCFTPYADTSGLVAARRLLEREVLTDVISADLSSIRTTDRESRLVAAPYVDRLHTTGGPASFGNWAAIAAFVEETSATVDAWQAEKGAYRSLYSRAQAVASHFAAAAVKLANPGLPWCAEMSDPLMVDINAVPRPELIAPGTWEARFRDALAERGFPQPEGDAHVYTWAELLVYALADEIVFTNELQRTYMLGYCVEPGLAERARAISRIEAQPTPPSHCYGLAPSDVELEDGVVTIAYFGAFYATRRPSDLTAAFTDLPQDLRRRVRLHVFGPDPDGLNLALLRDGLADVVRAHPPVPYLEFLHLCTRVDVLLVSDAAAAAVHGTNPYLPSKLSDYLGSGTPIWTLTEAGSSLDGTSSSYTSPLGDRAAAGQVLRRIVEDHDRLGRPLEVAG